MRNPNLDLGGSENATRVFPPKPRANTKTRSCHAQQRPVSAPAGEKHPPREGRALAGGFRPPAGAGRACAIGKGDGLCQTNTGDLGSAPKIQAYLRKPYLRHTSAKRKSYVLLPHPMAEPTPNLSLFNLTLCRIHGQMKRQGVRSAQSARTETRMGNGWTNQAPQAPAAPATVCGEWPSNYVTGPAFGLGRRKVAETREPGDRPCERNKKPSGVTARRLK
jgi:hypothetical protein